MKRELHLVPRGGDDTLAVIWDDETGDIEGKGADEVLRAIERYEPGTQIPCLPQCSGYTLSAEPRRSLPCMVVILYNHFLIPDWMMECYPEADKDDPSEAENYEPDGDDLPITEILH